MTPFVFQDVIKETFESSVEDGILTLKADVEGKDEVAKKTIEIKFENKKWSILIKKPAETTDNIPPCYMCSTR